MNCLVLGAGYPSLESKIFFGEEQQSAIAELETLLPPLDTILGVAEHRLKKILNDIDDSCRRECPKFRRDIINDRPFRGVQKFWDPKERFDLIRDLASLDEAIESHRLAAKICVITAAVFFVLSWVFLPWSLIGLAISIGLFVTSAYMGLRSLNLQYKYDKRMRELGRQEVMRVQEYIREHPISWVKKEAAELARRSDADPAQVDRVIESIYRRFSERFVELRTSQRLHDPVYKIFSLPRKEADELLIATFAPAKVESPPSLV